jgi:uncharacterized membrane protein YfcA
VVAARRGAALTLALGLLALLTTVMTDEGGVLLSERCTRVLPLIPACAAVATWLALAGPRRSMEVRALEALGRPPLESARAAAVGAALVGIVAALVLALDSRLELRGFFPTVHATGPYAFHEGIFTNLRTGWSVAPDGSISLATPAAAALDGTVPPHARLSAALVVAMGSVSFATTVAAFGRDRRRLAAVALFATALGSVVAFQAAAASRIPALVAVVPGTVLLAAVGWAILRRSRQASS